MYNTSPIIKHVWRWRWCVTTVISTKNNIKIQHVSRNTRPDTYYWYKTDFEIYIFLSWFFKADDSTSNEGTSLLRQKPCFILVCSFSPFDRFVTSRVRARKRWKSRHIAWAAIILPSPSLSSRDWPLPDSLRSYRLSVRLSSGRESRCLFVDSRSSCYTIPSLQHYRSYRTEIKGYEGSTWTVISFRDVNLRNDSAKCQRGHS